MENSQRDSDSDWGAGWALQLRLNWELEEYHWGYTVPPKLPAVQVKPQELMLDPGAPSCTIKPCCPPAADPALTTSPCRYWSQRRDTSPYSAEPLSAPKTMCVRVLWL